MEFLRFFLTVVQYLEDENIISNDYSNFLEKSYMKLKKKAYLLVFTYIIWFFDLLKMLLQWERQLRKSYRLCKMVLLHEAHTNATAFSSAVLLLAVLACESGVISKLLVMLGMKHHIIGYGILHASCRLWVFPFRGCFLGKD